MVDGKPPAHWRDADTDACTARLPMLAKQCDELSELAAAAGQDVDASVAIIGFLEPGADERRAVIACPSALRSPMAALIQELRLTARASGMDERAQFMALALTALDLPPATAGGRTGDAGGAEETAQAGQAREARHVWEAAE